VPSHCYEQFFQLLPGIAVVDVFGGKHKTSDVTREPAAYKISIYQGARFSGNL
jgi:hypothetical protein